MIDEKYLEVVINYL